MTKTVKITLGNGEVFVRPKQTMTTRHWMIYLLKPSPMIVAGLTPCVAIATSTLVAELRIKQFWAIPLAGKVVAGPCMMTMPRVFFSVCWGHAHARAGEYQESPAGAIDISMKTFHEWPAMREGLWLNDKNAIGKCMRFLLDIVKAD